MDKREVLKGLYVTAQYHVLKDKQPALNREKEITQALTALNKLEKEKIKSFKEIIKKHYEVFGYEKQHYLKEELEKMLDINIKVDGEQNLQRGQDE